MKKGLSVLLAVMMMCSFTVSSWAAETSNEAPPTDMQECCEETMYAGGREVFTDNSGVMYVGTVPLVTSRPKISKKLTFVELNS